MRRDTKAQNLCIIKTMVIAKAINLNEYCTVQDLDTWRISLIKTQQEQTKMQTDIPAKTYEEMRTKKRFDVNLKAVGKIVGHAAKKYQFIISNLSANGARLHFETPTHVKIGMSIALIIFIPNTVLTIPNTGKIMGITREGNVVSFGVKFQEVISEIMMNSLTEAKATA